MSFSEILKAKGADAGFALSPLMLEQFTRYYELLFEYNKVMNLTALTSPGDVALKHMVDSLMAYDPDMSGKTLADVGTGAGFPGLPLKLYCPTLRLTLIDSLAKRLHFLAKVVEELKLSDIDLKHLRAEDAGRSKDMRASFDFVTARAVARLAVLVEYCLPLVKTGGSFIALKGSRYAEEIEEAEGAIRILGGKIIQVKAVKLPDLDDGRAIIVIKKVKATPAAYPRKAGTPEKQPLVRKEVSKFANR